ncbi:MAG TPA: oligosaccharide flippase family protein [Acetobacteraceae bacterium]|jgi:O-antigen/teichoic acid export membrane protein|nr:oligosaccharide flippase family protein [Acetobacteraceae bacterium]
MSLKRNAGRLAAASISPVCVYAMRFLRTMILSHLLSPNDLGVAVALISILVSCEMVTDMALDRFVIVTDVGNRAQTVAAAQQISVSRATMLAIAIALFSPLLARMFGVGEHAGAVACLGFISFINGLRNWRMVQIQQDYRYGPEAIASICEPIAGICVIIAAYSWFHDERIVLASLATEAVVYVTLSHVLVRRERVAMVDPAIRKAAFAYGLPLMVNGIGLLVLKQFDQVIVVNLFGLQTLALYALGLNLAIAPASLLQSIAQKIGLPFMGRLRNQPEALAQAALLVLLGTIWAAAAYAVPVGVVLGKLVPMFYGSAYHVSATFCALVMLAVFLRFARGGPNMILLQHGLTSRLTIGNLVSGFGMVIGLVLGILSRRLDGVMVGIAIGDLLSLFVLLLLLRHVLALRAALVQTGVLTVVVGSVAAGWAAGDDLAQGTRELILLIGGLALICGIALAVRQAGRWFPLPSSIRRLAVRA